MQTRLDGQVVDWVGRLGAAGAEHVMGRFGMGRSWAYGRLRSLVGDGLLEQRALLHRRPGLYVATRAGLRWQGLQRMGVCEVRPGGFEHAWEVAAVAVALHTLFAGWTVLSDREIRVREREERQLVASAKVGALPDGSPVVHRPDLALVDERGRVSAVEVELSVKASARLAAICRGWGRSRHVRRVFYLAAPAAERAVRRAVQETRTEGRVIVLPLTETFALGANLAEGESSV
jgi:hypothetical protein